MLERLSLRARLVLGVVALAAVGLGVAGAVTYASLRSFLLDRTDASLEELSLGAGRLLRDGCRDDGRPLPGTGPGDYVEIRGPRGGVVCAVQMTSRTGAAPPLPELPRRLRATAAGAAGGARYLTVPARDGDGRYRVRVSTGAPLPATLVVATPLAGVDATLGRLLLIELVVAAAVLAALTALGLWVVRLGLRPLDEIGATAGAIAAGDLSRRVERAEPRTEVGRLGQSLNAMLGQIEAAFEARAASEQRLRRFVADASHELRTPLAAVRAYAELFSRGADRRPGDLARAMEGIERESERMSALVEDLLLLARLDEGRPLRREPVELHEVVAEAVETARALDPQRELELVLEDAVVLGDRERLRQIVDNLLGNVRAHTPAATPAAVEVARDDGHALVRVSDRGPGLSREDMTRVFERFYRADRSRSRAAGGVGLGLSIVAAVAEAHGGTVAAHGGRGAGATFEIRLPLAEKAQLERTSIEIAPT